MQTQLVLRNIGGKTLKSLLRATCLGVVVGCVLFVDLLVVDRLAVDRLVAYRHLLAMAWCSSS